MTSSSSPNTLIPSRQRPDFTGAAATRRNLFMIKHEKIGLLTGIATLMASASPALATGTTSGTSIQNTATVTYNVGNVAQPQVTSNTDNFVVDRKVILTVTPNGPATQVSPGQTKVVQTFTVTNSSNAPIDALLAATNLATGTAPSNGGAGNNDNFNTTNVAFVDTNGNGVLDANERTYVTGLAADASVVVTVISDVPITQKTGDRAVLSLTATAASGGNATTTPTAITQTAGANTKAGVETVFADAAGTDDLANDGKSSARNDLIVSAAALTAAKSSTVLNDGLGTAAPNAKAIPGATVQYCIAISNAANSATATNIVVNDVVPGTLTVQQSSIKVDAAVDANGLCSGGTTATNAASGNTVKGTLSDIAAGITRALSFEALVN